MSTLYYLVGLPGSGKSYWAESKKGSLNAVHISSDNLRLELLEDINNQECNDEIFRTMNKRTKILLSEDTDVIYDATNINSRRRKAFINELNKISCNKICVYFAIDPNICKVNNQNRDRTIKDEVIERMYKNLQIPMYYEGWDKIIIINNDDAVGECEIDLENIRDYNDYISILSNNILSKCIDFPQDNPHHTFSVSRHMYHVYKTINETTTNTSLKIAAMIHDVGKPYCKSFKDDSKYANFYGHENVSAQISIRYLLRAGFSTKDIINIATYVQLHMKLLNLQDSIKAKEKLVKDIGFDLYKDLELLRNADISAK